MPALNFMKAFADDVESGRKRMTIRLERKDHRPHCRVGDHLKLYTGMRSKSCRLLGTAVVQLHRRVVLYDECVELANQLLPMSKPFTDRLQGPPAQIFEFPTMQQFAEMDGFENYDQMIDWFMNTHEMRPFRGWCIMWGEPWK